MHTGWVLAMIGDAYRKMKSNTSNQPLISVLIPVYNVAEYLRKCIDSVLAQDFEDFELILVNDGSTDGSGEICESYRRTDSRIRTLVQDNKGLSAARNAALGEAKGEYVAFIDSDDFVADTYLSQLLKPVGQYNVDISICGRKIYYSESNYYNEQRPHFSNKILSGKQAVRALDSYDSYDMSAWGKLVRRNLYDDISYPLNRISEDMFVTYKLLYNAKSVYYSNDQLYYYRQRNGSISHSTKNLSLDPLLAAKGQFEYMSIHCPSLLDSAAAACFFSATSIINAYTLSAESMDKNTKENVFSDVRNYYLQTIHNPDIPIKKKIQASIIRYTPYLYKQILAIMKRQR